MIHISLRQIDFKQRIMLTAALLVATALLIINWLAYNNFKDEKITSIEEKSLLIVESG